MSKRASPACRRLAALATLMVTLGCTQTPTSPGITSASLHATIELLASDVAEGRETGSPAGLRAARGLAEALEQAGIQPAGDAGFLQAIDYVGFVLDGAPTLAWTGAAGARTEATRGADFDYAGGPPLARDLKVVVATAGTDAPRKPDADTALLLQGSRPARTKWLTDGGAPEGAGWGALLGSSQRPGTEPTSGPTGTYRVTAGGVPATPTRILVRGRLRDALLAGQVTTLHVAVRGRDVTPAANVVGRIAGVGTQDHPELAQQAVVFSAHYDHLGVRAAPPAATPPAAVDGTPATPAGPPDLVFNGADDDASGCAAVIALAQVFGAEARAGHPPARTLVFLLATGEEHGLLGTEFYLDHPAAPLDHTVVDLNFEMIGRPDPLAGGAGRLWLTGFERSNLGPAWAAAGLPVEPDQRPDQHFFERSDNYAFVERGVVGQTLSTYNLHADYHTVDDEIERLDFAHMEAAVRASVKAARALADGSLMPAWVKVAEGGAK